MALEEKEIMALGLDWGTWLFDCEAGVSTIIGLDSIRIELEIDVDVKKITDGLSQILPGAAKDKLEKVVKVLAKKLPKGKLKIFFQILPRAGATECKNGKRVVYYQVDLIAAFEAEVTLAGGAGKIKTKVTVFESIEKDRKLCDCKVVKKVAALPSAFDDADTALANLEDDEESAAAETNALIAARHNAGTDAIDSIGEATALKLAEAYNVSNLGELAAVDTRLAKKINVGISETRLKRYKLLAGLLITYPSLTHEGADTIVNGMGVKSIDEFFERAPLFTRTSIRTAVKKTQTPKEYIGEDIQALSEALKGKFV